MSADGSHNPRLTRRQLLASLGWAGATVAFGGPGDRVGAPLARAKPGPSRDIDKGRGIGPWGN